jgi:hypothetical protein
MDTKFTMDTKNPMCAFVPFVAFASFVMRSIVHAGLKRAVG